MKNEPTNCDDFAFKNEVTLPTIAEIVTRFPAIPPRVLVTLAVVTLLSRTVTPQRACGCGCGDSVTGKAKFASPACRKRLERERRALRAAGARQFGLVLQFHLTGING